jgi:hypothetical protein
VDGIFPETPFDKPTSEPEGDMALWQESSQKASKQSARVQLFVGFFYFFLYSILNLNNSGSQTIF